MRSRETLSPARPGPRGALGLVHLPVAVIAGLLFLVLNYRPVGGPELWSDVTYGSWILDHRSLPAEDPMVTLAAGMRFVDSEWLSQATLAAVHRWGGAESLSALFALTVVAAFLVLVRTLLLRSGRLLVGVVGALVALFLSYGLETAGPESFAFLVLSVLLWLLVSGGAEPTAEPLRARLWIGVPLLSALWANLHHSFPFAPLLVGCFFAGRLIEVVRDTRSWRSLVEDRWLKRWMLLSELSILATLVNPYGLDLWVHTLGLADNPFLQGRPEWRPLTLVGGPGLAFGLALVALAAVLRWSRRAVTPGQVVLLGVFGVAAALHAGALSWFAPVCALALTPHLAGFAERLGARARPAAGGRIEELLGYRSWSFSLLALALPVAMITLSPAVSALAPQRARDPFQLYGPSTPYLVTVDLRADPPRGLTMAPDWWAGWLTLDGPPRLELVVGRDVTTIPVRVWGDYRQVSTAHASWNRVLTRYAVDAVVVDAEAQRDLGRLLRQSEQWWLSYEDAQAMVFRRVRAARDAAAGQPGAAPDATAVDTPEVSR